MVEVGGHQVSQEVVGNIPNVEALVHKSDNLSTDEQEKLLGLLTKCGDVFASHYEDFGQTDVIKHTIPTGMAPPIRERYRPIPPQYVPESAGALKQNDPVRESTSPWAAPIVLVRKKEWGVKILCGLPKLETLSHKDAHSLPRIEETLTTLTQASYYSTLDLASGYWQVQVSETDREKTAFCTPFCFY